MPASEPDGTGQGHGLHIEVLGANVVLRQPRDDDQNERRFFSSVPSVPNSSAVLVTAATLRDPGFLAALREACRAALDTARTPGGAPQGRHRIWIVVSGLTRPRADGLSMAQRLAEEIPADIVAPDGPLVLVPGGTLFSGPHGGWNLFAAGSPPRNFAHRYPTPRWESTLPKGSTNAPGVLADQIPAGLFIRPSQGTPGDPVGGRTTVSQSPHHPRVLVSAPPVDPGVLASLIGRLHPGVLGQVELVPTSPKALPIGQVRHLAAALGNDVLVSTGFVLRDGNGIERTVVHDDASGESWHPFPRALRCSADGTTKVVAATPPPSGWVPAGPLAYRPSQDSGGVLARVVPAGLALAPGIPKAPTDADQLAFEAHRMTVAIGDPCVSLAPGTARALRLLLEALTPQQRGKVRLLVLGLADERTRAELVSAAGDLGQRLRFSQAITPQEAGPQRPPAPQGNPRAPSPQASTPQANPEAPARHGPSPQAPASPTPSAQAGSGDGSHQAAQPAATTTEGVLPPLPSSRPATVSAPPAELRENVFPVVRPKGADPSPAAAPAPRADAGFPATPERPPEQNPPEHGLVPAEPDGTAVDPAHHSTADERSRFAESAGAEFDEFLPSVNSALASFPALRDGTDQAKSDFVAVCFYLGRHQYGANSVNRALREGSGTAIRDYLACLTSGLRRMPVHRGAVFRLAHGQDEDSPLNAYEVGDVLAEPGFLSASSANDLTTEQDHVDMVIWSHSARRTHAFRRGGLPDEVVFNAATRFKVLEKPGEETEHENDDSAPAVLMRELRPGEDSAAGSLDENDHAILPRLQRALDRRHRTESPRTLDDPDQLMRLADPVGLVAAQAKVRAAPAQVAAAAAP